MMNVIDIGFRYQASYVHHVGCIAKTMNERNVRSHVRTAHIAIDALHIIGAYVLYLSLYAARKVSLD